MKKYDGLTNMCYEISVYCICGAVQTFQLNALRHNLIILGRQQNGCPFPQIGLCPDDETHLSQFMLYFVYDEQAQDWVLGCGVPHKKYWAYDERLSLLPQERQAQAGKNLPGKQISLIYHNEMSELLIKSLKTIKNKKAPAKFYDGIFAPLPQTGTVNLNGVSAIGLSALSQHKPLLFNGEKITCLSHPLFPPLPFGWFIEVKQNRTVQSAVRSLVKNSAYYQKDKANGN